jgi:hypothetical protein
VSSPWLVDARSPLFGCAQKFRVGELGSALAVTALIQVDLRFRGSKPPCWCALLRRIGEFLAEASHQSTTGTVALAEPRNPLNRFQQIENEHPAIAACPDGVWLYGVVM